MNKELKKKKAFFFAVSNETGINKYYSNFVYALCLNCMVSDDECSELYDINAFFRHDMLTVVDGDIKNSIYNCIYEYDTFIFLLDEIHEEDAIGYNPNVWFELGLASSQRNKNIILISRAKEKLPFYTQWVQPVHIQTHLYKYFKENHELFQGDEEFIDEWLGHIENMLKDTSKESPLAKEISSFKRKLKIKLKKATNPFKHNDDAADIKAIGFGDVYQLLNSINISKTGVIADFIPQEYAAFDKLTESIITAKKSLRTTRFANRSITSGQRTNRGVQEYFMTELCRRSHELTSKENTSDRIICNNNFRKWHDIYKALLNGGGIRIYVRKKCYSIGYEMVIIDEKTTFIHFYQLSTIGNSNSDGTENEPENEVINSTLKICDEEVSKKMVNVFDRLHHRDHENPSRTLLGIPVSDEEYDEYLNTIEDEENGEHHGILYLPEPYDVDKRTSKVIKLLLDKIDLWYKYMKTADRVLMIFGVLMVAIDLDYGFNSTQVKSLMTKIKAEKKEFEKLIKDEYKKTFDESEKDRMEKICMQYNLTLMRG